MNIANAAFGGLLPHLAFFALRTLALALFVAATLCLLRARSTSLRLLSWTAVLYAAFAIPLLGWMLPGFSVPVPSFVEKTLSPVARQTETNLDTTARQRSLAVQQISVETKSIPAEWSGMNSPAGPRADTIRNQSPRIPFAWGTLATAIYLGVSLALLARILMGLVLAHRLVRSAKELQDPRITSNVAARASGLSWVPSVRESAAISVPVTIGALRSSIVLPRNWPEWDDEKLDAVIAHEMSHVARRDALTQCISLLHRAIFWFSPLSWWLHQHLAELAEQASDEAALCGGADRGRYARTLLSFFETLQVSPGRVWWHGVAMASVGRAEKRLERILTWKGAITVGLKKSAVIMIIAFAIPVVYLAASARPTSAAQSAPPVAPDRAPAPPSRAALATPAIPAPPSTPATAQVLPFAPAAPPAIVGVALPVPAIAGQSHSTFSHGTSFAYGFDDEQRFVIVSGKSDAFTMSGSSEDAHHVEKLRKQISGDFIWFQRDEKSFIIRDQATIDRARKLWAPQEELGKQQEELGRQQEALGKQQEELGARMEQIQVKVPDLTAQLDKLRAELKALSSGATAEQVGHLQSEIGELQSQLGEVQSHAGEQQGKLGEEMGALGEKQGKLGEQQGKLGEQQGKLAEQATREMKSLFDEAIKNGTAKPEPPDGGSGTL